MTAAEHPTFRVGLAITGAVIAAGGAGFAVMLDAVHVPGVPAMGCGIAGLGLWVAFAHRLGRAGIALSVGLAVAGAAALALT